MVKITNPAKKRGVKTVTVEDKNTSRTLSFLRKVKVLLASTASLEIEVIAALMKGEIRAEFAHAVLKSIIEIIKSILLRS